MSTRKADPGNSNIRVAFLVNPKTQPHFLHPVAVEIDPNGNPIRLKFVTTYSSLWERLEKTPAEKELISYLNSWNGEYSSKSDFPWNGIKNSLILTREENKLIPVPIKERKITLELEDQNGQALPIPLIKKSGNWQPLVHYEVLDIAHNLIYWQNEIIHIRNWDKLDLSARTTLLTKKSFSETEDWPGLIEKANLQAFLHPDFPVHKISGIPIPLLTLKEMGPIIEFTLLFSYGDDGLLLKYEPGKNRKLIYRESALYEISKDSGFEAQAVELLSGLDEVCFIPGKWEMAWKKGMNWLLKNFPKLDAFGFHILNYHTSKRVKLRKARPSIEGYLKSSQNWLDLQIHVNVGKEAFNLEEVLTGHQPDTNFVRLPDGSYIRLGKKMLEQLEFLYTLSEKKSRHNLKFPRYLLPFLHEELTGFKDYEVDSGLQEKLDKLKSFRSIQQYPLPGGWQVPLRDYQKQGYNWLNFLQEFEFGGCLADDMGLGKTAQVLALLSREKAAGQPTSLVIAPASVIFNWEIEIKKFTPHLTYRLHFGTGRSNHLEDLTHCDVLITTYGTALRDIPILSEIAFHYIILDESQKIKNPHTLTARAMRKLKSGHRLVMTGTPIENSAIELWSQFAFLNPGMLGSLSKFKERFARPIEKRGDRDAASRLRRMIFPFILRRSKDQVARELPPRQQKTIFCEMTPKQAAIYNEWRDKYRKQILEQVDREGIHRVRINILAAMTRLRQISCHPALVNSPTKADSGKLDLMLDNLLEILGEKHKVLIFSQFVEMLQIIKKELVKKKVRFSYLDGRSRNRDRIVAEFQKKKSIPVFLISLKAGGFGLNLTAADYVLHIDPWWNPAVERQASDRVHRIGQTRPVFIYKFISKNSIEEKILALQQAKQQLVKELITTEKDFVKHLTREDLEMLFER